MRRWGIGISAARSSLVPPCKVDLGSLTLCLRGAVDAEVQHQQQPSAAAAPPPRHGGPAGAGTAESPVVRLPHGIQHSTVVTACIVGHGRLAPMEGRRGGGGRRWPGVLRYGEQKRGNPRTAVAQQRSQPVWILTVNERLVIHGRV